MPLALAAHKACMERGKFYLPDNFELSAKGIRFTYNSYEISNWAKGMIEFTLTKGQIQPY